TANRLARETQTPWSSKLSRPLRGITDVPSAHLHGRCEMSWANKRRRTVQKLVTFTPDEWERVNSLHKKVNKYTTRYRSFTVFARKMLTDGEIRVTEIRPLTDPEPLAREIGRIGVNVNQIAHWANANEHITAEQVAELRASFDRIERLLGDLFANKRTAGKDV
ncbi:MAG: MobC family plasmid mobilization relaxosome protein, partial [Bifidobacterium breve]|nr:MobC family plasmid mobilization relaxosome protein [Bifidobacterium breve]